jgi:trans-2,3-dihydro-3-hydroxyanthranilate isomerase
VPPTPRSYEIVDVFTDTPLEGNAVAVFTDGAGLDDALMQRTARELNLSETVFLLRPTRPTTPTQPDAVTSDARARIFTPATELPFAGHPVLGAAFVLSAQTGADTIRLETGAGQVSISLSRADGRPTFGEMEQPIPTWEDYDRQDQLLAALGLGRSGLPIEVYSNGPRHAYVELPDEAAVTAVRPDMGALSELGALGVSCFAGGGAQFKTRMFGPGLGVPEDPATGSAAGPLAVHLARHGRIAFGDRIEIRQGAEIGRPSVLQACAQGSADALERVLVGGAAVTVARGEYQLGSG